MLHPPCKFSLLVAFLSEILIHVDTGSLLYLFCSSHPTPWMLRGLIHSDGHLGFQFLAVINKCYENSCTYLLFEFLSMWICITYKNCRVEALTLALWAGIPTVSFLRIWLPPFYTLYRRREKASFCCRIQKSAASPVLWGPKLCPTGKVRLTTPGPSTAMKYLEIRLNTTWLSLSCKIQNWGVRTPESTFIASIASNGISWYF